MGRTMYVCVHEENGRSMHEEKMGFLGSGPKENPINSV
jgi:hypothetical protein